MGRPPNKKALTCAKCSVVFYMHQRSNRKYCSKACCEESARARIFDPGLNLKRCAKCMDWKPLEQFQNQSKNVGTHGKQAYCIPCHLVKSNEWTQKNPELKKIHRIKYRTVNAEKIRTTKRNPTEDQRKKKNVSQRNYRIANPDKVREWNLARVHTLRARGKVTREMMEKLLSLQKSMCVICRVNLRKSKKHLDHIIPISAGGTNEFGNLQFLCPSCNLAKRAREPVAFMQSRGFLI